MSLKKEFFKKQLLVAFIAWVKTREMGYLFWPRGGGGSRNLPFLWGSPLKLWGMFPSLPIWYMVALGPTLHSLREWLKVVVGQLHKCVYIIGRQGRKPWWGEGSQGILLPWDGFYSVNIEKKIEGYLKMNT